MKLEDRFTNIEQSNKLWKLGLDQTINPGDGVWSNISRGPHLCVLGYNEDLPPAIYRPVKAYSVAELGIMLPRNFASFHCGYDLWRIANTFDYANIQDSDKIGSYFTGKSRTYMGITGQTEADVRANCLIYLIEGGHISVDEINGKLLA